MKKILIFSLLILPVLLFSCKNKEEKRMHVIDEELIINILRECVRQDSLNEKIPISNKLKYYNLYIPHDFYDDVPIPPPPDTAFCESISLEWFIKRINDTTSFSFEKDSTHIKEELIASRNLYSSFILPDSIHNTIEISNEIDNYYVFYVPIFNRDSSAVYLQYDHVNGIMGGGMGFLFEKNGTNWVLKKKKRNGTADSIESPINELSKSDNLPETSYHWSCKLLSNMTAKAKKQIF